MRQIAECLQIKAPSLYHHFPSTETLAQQAFGH
ncbi:TetR family transcriptional regulator [Xanthobacter cornucopiae]